MKRIFAALVALFIAALGAVALASPASATGGNQVEGKPVTVCHATGSAKNPYVKLTNVQLVQFFGQNGHAAHENDIWAPFDYYTREGHGDEWTLVHQAGQGDQSLLAFDDCQAPVTPEDVTVTINTVDKCGIKNDAVTAVANPVSGAVVNVNKTGDTTYVVSADANEGFRLVGLSGWNVTQEGLHATKTVTLTDEDCDLPETGSEATYATGIGVAALAAVALLGMGLYNTRRRNAE